MHRETFGLGVWFPYGRNLLRFFSDLDAEASNVTESEISECGTTGFGPVASSSMTDVENLEDLPPVAGATIVYLGPVAPHWEIRAQFGETEIIDGFRARVNARLLLLPKHDPQFRRNRERVNRDGERELIRVDWDLGDEEPPREPRAPRTPAPVAEEAPAEEPVVEEPGADEPTADAPEAADEGNEQTDES